MTARDLIKLLLEHDLDSEVFFEVFNEDMEEIEESTIITINDVFAIIPTNEEGLDLEDELPILVLTQNVLHPDATLN